MNFTFQLNGGSIGEEVMENSDVGDHEDADVRNERQKVFNLMTTSSIQEPPVVVVQVSIYWISIELIPSCRRDEQLPDVYFSAF